MTGKWRYILLLSLLLLLSCGGGERMRRELAALESCNQADSLLTDSTLAMRLTDYFDTYGTPNERLHAHYLLARTWADLGQSPRALDEFHRAAEQAETASMDCDYRQLAKAKGQLGELLFSHSLWKEALEAFDESYHYALHVQDTLLAIREYSQKAKCHYSLNQKDSAFVVFRKATEWLLLLGDTLSANTNAGPLSYFYTLSGDYTNAKKHIDLYENSSIVSQDTVLHRVSWDLFHIQKGFYYLGVERIDSAIILFHQGLNCSDIANRQLACDGLYKSYIYLKQPDSIAKYAILRTEENDSLINMQLAHQLQQMQAVYNYDRYKILAEEKSIESVNARLKQTFLSFLVVSCLFAIVIVTVAALLIINRKKLLLQRVKAKYSTDLLLYAKTKEELERLRHENASNEKKREEIEERLSYLSKHIAGSNESDADAYTELLQNHFLNSDIVCEVKQYASKGKLLPEECWVELFRAVNAYIPDFLKKIEALHAIEDNTDKRLCILSLIRIPQKSKAALLGLSYSAAAMRRKRLHSALFETAGSAKEFEKDILKLFFS